MRRKQKNLNIKKEYGVKNTNFHKDDTDIIENQIVQLNIPVEESKVTQYNPTISEPTGLEAEGISECQHISAQTQQQEVELKRQEEQRREMELKNSQIETYLTQRQQKFKNLDKKQMMQWIDLQGSAAYEDFNRDWPNIETPCQWCLDSFDGLSWPLVVGRNKKGTFLVRGNHCSPQCALAHGLDSREISENISASSLYSWMMAFIYKVTGHYDSIRPSPPRFMMKKFGGPMTSKQFHLESQMEHYSSYLTYPPLETSVAIWNRIQQTDHEEEDDTSLVLKRSKPVYDTNTSLESIWKR